MKTTKKETENEIRKVKNAISEINRYRRLYGDKIAAMERLPLLKEKLKDDKTFQDFLKEKMLCQKK